MMNFESCLNNYTEKVNEYLTGIFENKKAVFMKQWAIASFQAGREFVL